MNIRRAIQILEELEQCLGKPAGDTIQQLAELRERIDDLDKALVVLLNERSVFANKIGAIKKDMSMPVYVPDREAQVIRNVTEGNPGPLHLEAIRRLFERIIDETRALERQKYQQSERQEKTSSDDDD